MARKGNHKRIKAELRNDFGRDRRWLREHSTPPLRDGESYRYYRGELTMNWNQHRGAIPVDQELDRVQEMDPMGVRDDHPW